MLLGGNYDVGRARRRPRARPTSQELELAGLRFVVDHTPGHTEGSVTFRTPYAEQDVSEVMFSGDLLFAGSIGRTDLPGGDHADDAAQPRRQGAAAGRRHRRAARPRRADLHRPRARHQPLPAERPGRPATRGSEMSKITPLSGFPELLPAQRVVEREVDRVAVAHLRAARLRQHRDPRRRAARPAAPRAARSTRRSTSSGGSHAEPDARARRLGLHFDLTVPFARYVLENAGQARVPVPALPDPAGLARRAAAGGPLPRSSPRPTSTSSAATSCPSTTTSR